MTIQLITNLMFLTSIVTLGGLSIWQAVRGQIGDVLVTNAIAAVLIWAW